MDGGDSSGSNLPGQASDYAQPGDRSDVGSEPGSYGRPRKFVIQSTFGVPRERRSRKSRPCDACRRRKTACIIAVEPPCESRSSSLLARSPSFTLFPPPISGQSSTRRRAVSSNHNLIIPHARMTCVADSSTLHMTYQFIILHHHLLYEIPLLSLPLHCSPLPSTPCCRFALAFLLSPLVPLMARKYLPSAYTLCR